MGPAWPPVRSGSCRLPSGVKATVPGVNDRELDFRTRAVAGMLNWLVLAPVGTELRNKSEKQLERLLVPIFAGAFRGLS